MHLLFLFVTSDDTDYDVQGVAILWHTTDVKTAIWESTAPTTSILRPIWQPV